MNKKERAVRDKAIIEATQVATRLLRSWWESASVEDDGRYLHPDYAHAFGIFHGLALAGLTPGVSPALSGSIFQRLVAQVEHETPLERLARA